MGQNLEGKEIERGTQLGQQHGEVFLVLLSVFSRSRFAVVRFSGPLRTEAWGRTPKEKEKGEGPKSSEKRGRRSFFSFFPLLVCSC